MYLGSLTIQLLLRALDLGINHLDTSGMYSSSVVRGTSRPLRCQCSKKLS